MKKSGKVVTSLVVTIFMMGANTARAQYAEYVGAPIPGTLQTITIPRECPEIIGIYTSTYFGKTPNSAMFIFGEIEGRLSGYIYQGQGEPPNSNNTGTFGKGMLTTLRGCNLSLKGAVTGERQELQLNGKLLTGWWYRDGYMPRSDVWWLKQ